MDKCNTFRGTLGKKTVTDKPRVGEHAPSTAVAEEELKIKNSRILEPPDSTVTAAESDGEEEKTEEEDVEDEDLTAPVELIMKFLRAVMDRDLVLASKLCQMILIFEPDNPEASEFLPLIRKKLLEKQEAEQSTEEEEEEEEEEDDDVSNGSGSDEESSHSSSCSSSPPSDDDDDEEMRVNRHKPCPPCQIPPTSM